MKFSLVLLSFVLVLNPIIAQTTAMPQQNRKPFSLEATVGYNYFFTQGLIKLGWTDPSYHVPVSPYQTFIAGLLLNSQIETDKQLLFDFGFGLQYGLINYTQQQRTADGSRAATIRSKYGFLRPEVVSRFYFFNKQKVTAFVSAGAGFNFSTKGKPTIDVEYDASVFDYFRKQSSAVRPVSFNPKLAAGFKYQRNRIEFAYAFPSDISNNATYKLKTGYLALNYFLRVNY